MVNETDNVVIEKVKMPIISKSKKKARTISLRKQQELLIDILGRTCRDSAMHKSYRSIILARISLQKTLKYYALLAIRKENSRKEKS